MTANITQFLNERKANWLKEKLKNVDDESKISLLTQQANEKFSPAEWVPDAARRAAQIFIVSHPSKFSHPSAKTSTVIAEQQYEADGYLRSGNVDYPLDVFGNAAAMDVHKFLSLTLSDDRTVLVHLEQETKLIQSALHFPTANFTSIKEAFLQIKAEDTEVKTSNLVKQVYFPIGNDQYHLLSLLTPSGLMTELKQRIDHMRFSDETKAAKEKRKKNEFDEYGFSDLYDLTITAFGGTKPQNISVLNNQNAGRAYLLPSMPPSLQYRKIPLPKYNFFSQSVYRKQFQASFVQLHKLFSAPNNKDVRTGIKNILRFIIDRILFTAFCIRQNPAGWSTTDYYSTLPYNQRIWLDDHYRQQRDEQDEWRNEISTSIARWIINSYPKSIHQAYKLSDYELSEFKQLTQESLEQDKEYF